MNNKLKQIIIYIAGAIFVVGGVVFAGSLEPLIDTDTVNFVTLDDLYHKTQDFNYSAIPHDISTLSAPLSSMHTLQDIWDSISSNLITPEIIVSGNTIFGISGIAEAPASVTWSADSYNPSYDCSWFTDMTDPMFSTESICSFNPGCSWDGSTCTGGMQTSPNGMVTLYAAIQACAHSTEGGHAEGDWGLPTIGQLLNASSLGSQPVNNFNNSPGSMYLSGNLYPNMSMMVYVVEMSANTPTPITKMSGATFGRCVLGGITSIPVVIPGAPIIGNAIAGYDGQATVSFSPNVNGGSDITNYTVTSDPEGITATGGSNPITVTGLTNGTPYTFTVTATNAVGTSPASAVSNSVTPIPSNAPSAPLNVNATAGDGQAEVTFDPPSSNGGSEIISYTVTSDPEGITATGAYAPITITGLTNDTAYTFTVTATNNAGTGPASAPSSSVTPFALVCAPEQGICSSACNAPFNNLPDNIMWTYNNVGGCVASYSVGGMSKDIAVYSDSVCDAVSVTIFGPPPIGGTYSLPVGDGKCAYLNDVTMTTFYYCPSYIRIGGSVVNNDCIYSMTGGMGGGNGGLPNFNANSSFFTGN